MKELGKLHILDNSVEIAYVRARVTQEDRNKESLNRVCSFLGPHPH